MSCKIGIKVGIKRLLQSKEECEVLIYRSYYLSFNTYLTFIIFSYKTAGYKMDVTNKQRSRIDNCFLSAKKIKIRDKKIVYLPLKMDQCLLKNI
jgi:hypothetical protein